MPRRSARSTPYASPTRIPRSGTGTSQASACGSTPVLHIAYALRRVCNAPVNTLSVARLDPAPAGERYGTDAGDMTVSSPRKSRGYLRLGRQWYGVGMDKTPIPLEKTIEAIGVDRAAICAMREPTYSSLPRPGYALPMAWRCGVEVNNAIVDAVPRYSSADHGSLFKSLLTVVCNIRSTATERFSGPHFDAVLAQDEVIESCLELEHSQLACLNLEVSLREGYWRASYHSAEDAFRLSLAPPQRRSALALINIKAAFLSYPREVREILSGDLDETSPMRTVSLTLATGLDEIVFLRDAIPGAWSRLTERIGFNINEAVQFQAFVQALFSTGKLWFLFEDLAEWYADFAKDQKIEMIVEDRFRQLVEFFPFRPRPLRSGVLLSRSFVSTTGLRFGRLCTTYSRQASPFFRFSCENIQLIGTTRLARTSPRSRVSFAPSCRTCRNCFSPQRGENQVLVTSISESMIQSRAYSCCARSRPYSTAIAPTISSRTSPDSASILARQLNS